jgi:hypothetical protein
MRAPLTFFRPLHVNMKASVATKQRENWRTGPEYRNAEFLSLVHGPQLSVLKLIKSPIHKYRQPLVVESLIFTIAPSPMPEMALVELTKEINYWFNYRNPGASFYGHCQGRKMHRLYDSVEKKPTAKPEFGGLGGGENFRHNILAKTPPKSD